VGRGVVGNLVPVEFESRLRVFTLVRGRVRVGWGTQFTDGRVAVAWVGGREEVHPSMDHFTAEYVGMCGLLWADGEKDWDRVPRRFLFRRDRDGTGVSGTGWAMEGVQYPDGRVVLEWLGPFASLVHWACMRDAVTIVGHGGDTVLQWLDELAWGQV
jgi:hypothetical protein